MNYTNHIIARTEHEAANRSLLPPQENGFYAIRDEKQRFPTRRLRVALLALINLIVRSA